MIFFKKHKKNNRIDYERLPEHIGVIMDGNGRWAKKEACREAPDIPQVRTR